MNELRIKKSNSLLTKGSQYTVCVYTYYWYGKTIMLEFKVYINKILL